MTPIPAGNLIIADGEYSLAPAFPGRCQLVEFEVISGTATVAIGTVSIAGGFRGAINPATEAAPVFAATGGRWEVCLGSSGQAAVKVTAAAGAQIRIGLTDCEE